MSVADYVREEGKITVAEHLLLKRYDIETVAESAELDLETVKKLKKPSIEAI